MRIESKAQHANRSPLPQTLHPAPLHRVRVAAASRSCRVPTECFMDVSYVDEQLRRGLFDALVASPVLSAEELF